MYDRHAGAHRAASHDELPTPRDERGVSYLDASDIGDRVERSWGASDERVEAEVAGALALREGEGRDRSEKKHRRESIHSASL
jgi:hypothetical protein